jgi:glycosyltransferase involved in cell wall biosynthesis
MPTVSVCIPTFNRKDYLRQALESLQQQTYKDFETIVLDDGSTDGTGEMIKQMGYNVKYRWQGNAGEAATTNRLIELSGGDYISFLHSDDLLFPDAIERMVKAVEAANEDVVVYGNYVKVDENGNIFGESKRKLYSGRITARLFEDIIVHPVGSMFPKRAIVEVGGLDESLRACYDYKMELMISLKYSFVALDKPTFKRRRHSGNTSMVSFANQLAELEVLKDFYCRQGGKDYVPENMARKRLAREAYRAGRSAIDEKLFQKGYELLKESYGLSPNLKTLFYLWKVKRENERTKGN